MEDPNFYANWLNDRYPYDSEARNKDLEAVMLSYLAPKKTVTLVDVGAGTGSNALYLMDKIERDQHWYFIEQNVNFREVLLRRLREYAEYHKYDCLIQNGIVQITTSNKQLSFQFIEGSLLNIEQLVPLATIDIVVANAVFDLFSKEQIQHFLQTLLPHPIACYFTLNYQGMVYTPEDLFDNTFIDLYHAHMERPQPTGKAMGKQVSAFLEETLKTTYSVYKHSSTWHIRQEDIKMHYYLLNFMENAIPELALNEEVSTFFPKWIQRKKELIISRQLDLKVHHWDIFSIPILDFSR